MVTDVSLLFVLFCFVFFAEERMEAFNFRILILY